MREHVVKNEGRNQRITWKSSQQRCCTTPWSSALCRQENSSGATRPDCRIWLIDKKLDRRNTGRLEIEVDNLIAIV